MAVKYPQWLVFENVLSEEECDLLIEQAREVGQIKASTFGGTIDDTRKTNIRWLNDNSDFGWIHLRLREYTRIANEKFGMRLSHLPALQFTEYEEVGHHYHYHHDVEFNDQKDTQRKVSLVVQLSDPEEYEGGEFAFKHLEQPPSEMMMKRGTLLAFISYHEHMVSPIESGERRSLVGWYEGPRYI
ncbi:MAG: 2OG-Fe(II) oxygenase [Euryarchaeota archaeon]|nr:2OG-Fe(II) oxygenase [Euryarchaeota archaeon]